MALLDIEVQRSKSSELIVQTLPDGSTAIFEKPTKNVYSLNPSAAAAWEASASATTLSGIATGMSRRLNAPVSEELAHEAVSELAAAGLVTVTPGERLATSRRAMLKQTAGVAIPVVLVLTGAQQRAHAQGAGSPPLVTTSPGGGSTTPPPTTPPLTTTAPLCRTADFIIVKKQGENADGSFSPLAGAVFEVRNRLTNALIETVVTNASGEGWVVSGPGPGAYKLVEISAPGGPWVIPGPVNFNIGPTCEPPVWFDRTNFLLTTTGT